MAISRISDNLAERILLLRYTHMRGILHFEFALQHIYVYMNGDVLVRCYKMDDNHILCFFEDFDIIELEKEDILILNTFYLYHHEQVYDHTI